MRCATLRAVFLIALAWAATASADDELGNVAHVVDGPYGLCYARSVPLYGRDPFHGPRQQGHTEIHVVGEGEDTLVERHEWFSQTLFLLCRPGTEILLVRVGPWHRGYDPRPDHLAIAFYRGGQLVRRYSTLDIAGDEPSGGGTLSAYANVAASVSHYRVFSAGPEMVRRTVGEGSARREAWVITATTVDGRELVFDMATGNLR